MSVKRVALADAGSVDIAAAATDVTHHLLKGVIAVSVGAAGSVSIDDGVDTLLGPIDIAAVKEVEFDFTDPDGNGLTGIPVGAAGRVLQMTTVGTGDVSATVVYRSV